MSLNIEGAFLKYRFCHNRDCVRWNSCLRNEDLMPLNYLSCRMENTDCNSENNFKYYLGELPDKNELPETHFGNQWSGSVGLDSDTTDTTCIIPQDNEVCDKIAEFLNNEIAHSRKLKFYMEPFVGNSGTIHKIQGIQNMYGTDTDMKSIERLKSTYSGIQFQTYGYQTWDKVLLNDKYKGRCMVYCEPRNVDLDEFIKSAREWAKLNRVYVRCGKLPRRKPILQFSEQDNVFQL